MATKQRRTAGRVVTTVNRPSATAQFDQPDRYLPTCDELAFVVNTVRGYLPSSRMTAFYGSLGALVVMEVIDWPVAAAIAVGAWRSSHAAEIVRSRLGNVTPRVS